MHLLVTGGTGFIGSQLVPELIARGNSVTVLTRRARQGHEYLRYVTDLEQVVPPVHGVINLAGASLSAKRWTESYKAEMVSSRVNFTRRLVEWLSSLEQPPEVLLSGSAIGYYGTSDTDRFTESSSAGSGFAAELCEAWEGAASVAEGSGVRVVLLRLGVVFDKKGGALPQMLRSFQFGIGSWMGRGDQWLSWVHRADVVRAIVWLLENQSARGPMNIVSPDSVTHRDFCYSVSTRKPTLFNAGIPAVLARTLLGELADELLLNGQRVLPESLRSLGFDFQFDTLDSALKAILARPR